MIAPTVPLYYSIIEYLMKEIEDGTLVPGDMVPSERELMEKFRMSRTTIRKALDVMDNEGYLRRVQGKGTFVAEKKRQHGLNYFASFSELVRSQGAEPSYRVISSSVVPARPAVAQDLGIGEGEKIFRLERVLYADREPISITISHIPFSYIPDAEGMDFSSHSLYKTLEEKFGITICRSTRSIEAISCGDKDSVYLDASPDLPVLLFKGVMYGTLKGQTAERPIEYFFSKIRSDKYRLQLEQVYRS